MLKSCCYNATTLLVCYDRNKFGKGSSFMIVAICDDNLIFLEEFEQILSMQPKVQKVFAFSSPLEFILQVKEGKHFDAVFMDIDYPVGMQKNGFGWSEELYTVMPDIPIIFITGYNDHFAQHVMLTKANVLGYMTKPVESAVLEKYLDKIKKKNSHKEYLFLSIQGKKISLDVSQIIHLESHNHKVIIFTEDDIYTVYEKLVDIKMRLSADFIQCHKSFLVNRKWIRLLEGQKLILRNKREIPISRSYLVDVREAFFKYMGEEI